MRILIAEDDFASRVLLEAILIKWGYEVQAVNDGQAALQVLENDNPPPIAVLDWMMPGISGVDLCTRVRSLHREIAPYILMLTAKGLKTDVSAGLDAGADDYLVKPFDLSELGARIRVAKRAISLQLELVESRHAIRYQALHDLSTGALNRGSILSALSERMGTSDCVTVQLIAIDGHRGIQQRQGAECAEATVRTLVQRVRRLDGNALIGRYSADELLVVLPNATLATGAALAERMRKIASSAEFRDSAGADQAVTISIGIASADTRLSLELLLCYADTALHAARAAGDCVEIFGMEFDEPLAAQS
jgi:diguanylate cyclase (GGDEF)-like protein